MSIFLNCGCEVSELQRSLLDTCDEHTAGNLRDRLAMHCGATLQVHVFVGEDGEIQLPNPGSMTPDQEQRLAAWKAKFSYLVADAMLVERAKS